MGRVPIVMRSDGSVSAMRLTDLKGIAERDERIRQLEKQCASLADEVDRQRPVVEAAVAYLKYEGNDRKELITLRARINSAAFQYEVNRPK